MQEGCLAPREEAVAGAVRLQVPPLREEIGVGAEVRPGE